MALRTTSRHHATAPRHGTTRRLYAHHATAPRHGTTPRHHATAPCHGTAPRRGATSRHLAKTPRHGTAPRHGATPRHATSRQCACHVCMSCVHNSGDCYKHLRSQLVSKHFARTCLPLAATTLCATASRMATEPLQNLTEQSAGVGVWLLSVASGPRPVEYTWTKASQTGTDKKFGCLLVSDESTQHCIGVYKRKGKEPDATKNFYLS